MKRLSDLPTKRYVYAIFLGKKIGRLKSQKIYIFANADKIPPYEELTEMVGKLDI